MKNNIKLGLQIFGMLILIAGIFALAITAIGVLLNDLSKEMADVEKCQRVTEMGFFECSNLQQQELNNF